MSSFAINIFSYYQTKSVKVVSVYSQIMFSFFISDYLTLITADLAYIVQCLYDAVL